MRKRLLNNLFSALLCLCLALGLLPATAWAANTDTREVGIYLRTLREDAPEQSDTDEKYFIEIPEEQLNAMGLARYSNTDFWGNWIDYGRFDSKKAAEYSGTQNRGSEEVKAVVSELSSGSVRKTGGISADLSSLNVTWDTLSWSNSLSGFSWHLNGELRICTVTFQRNDGTDEVYDTRYCVKGKNTGSGFPAAAPARDGYTFDGWYTKADGGEEVTSIGVLDGDTAYYAHWTENRQEEQGHTHFLCGGGTCRGESHAAETGKTTFEKEIRQEGSKLYIGGQEWFDPVQDADLFPVLSDGIYYLSSDIAAGKCIKIKGKVTLCLNGHTIRGPEDDRAIEVVDQNLETVFTLTDCQGSGKITHEAGKRGGGISVNAGATFDLYEGTISGNTVGTDGGGVYVYEGMSYPDGAFHMYGGSISGNTANESGGGVYSGGSFTMTGGNISGNKGEFHGGGVYSGGSFTMTGGSISGNTATYGGGVYSSGSFTMTGGNITGNNSSCLRSVGAGGVYVNLRAVFQVSGNVKISDNVRSGIRDSETGRYVKGSGGSDSNVYLNEGRVITIGTAGLEDGASVGVTTEKIPEADSPIQIAAGAAGSADYVTIFTPDVTGSNYAVTRDPDGNLFLGIAQSTHQHSWNYEQKAGGADTITATCRDCQASGGSLTIKAPVSLTYDGQPKKAVLEKENWKGGDFSLVYYVYYTSSENETAVWPYPVHAGKYRAVITAADSQDGSDVSASVTYTISKAAQAAPAGLTAENARKDAGCGKLIGTTADMEYNRLADADTGWISCTEGSTEVEPGTWYVRYRESDNYFAGSASAALTVGSHVHSGGTATCQKRAVCDECRKEYGELAAHKYTKAVKSDSLKSAATCGSRAVYYKSCEVCGKKSAETFENGELDAANHVGGTYVQGKKEATSEAEGYTGDTCCSTCRHVISKGKTIAKKTTGSASGESSGGKKENHSAPSGSGNGNHAGNSGGESSNKENVSESVSAWTPVKKKDEPNAGSAVPGTAAVAGTEEAVGSAGPEKASAQAAGHTTGHTNGSKTAGGVSPDAAADTAASETAENNAAEDNSQVIPASESEAAAEQLTESGDESPADSSQNGDESPAESPKSEDRSGIAFGIFASTLLMIGFGAIAFVIRGKRLR